MSAHTDDVKAEIQNERKFIEVATFLFTAFARGVARRDVSSKRMSQSEADQWVDDASTSFKTELRKYLK